MTLTSPRFGTLSFTEEQTMLFPDGILVAPDASTYIVIDDPQSAPFQWLVCVERPEQAFSVLDPALVLSDATAPVNSPADTTTFVLATPGSGDVAWWLDLRHPIVINNGQRRGEQVTLDDTSLPEHFPVRIEHPNETAE
jgi:flagellar assembly factor FliW